jgi:Domain of unknown function (DUF3846)
MTGDITYMVVRPDGSFDMADGPLGVEDAQRILDGDFEAMPQPDDLPITILAATEGKTRGDEANWAVTRLIHSHLRPGDFVAGKAIITGGPDKDGNLTTLTTQMGWQVREAMSAT